MRLDSGSLGKLLKGYNAKMKSSVRLYAILARKAPLGVVFRRGPSNHVLVVKWNTETDSFEHGQWLKGRIYERRCDLSPKGDLLLYFAANYRSPYRSWTAVSRPPYLTALALWPKGDAWGGGGSFESQTRIALNHRHQELVLAEGFKLPKRFKIGLFGKRPGWGEDDPIWSQRLTRDGWTLVTEGDELRRDFNAKVWIELNPPRIFSKPHPTLGKQYALDLQIVGVHEKNGPSYVQNYSILKNGFPVDMIEGSDWADWSQSGDLLFAHGGCLFRLALAEGILPSCAGARKIADFSNLKFEAVEAPWEARHWPTR